MRAPSVDEGSGLERLATWRSHQVNRPLAAAMSGSSDPWFFVMNEVLVNARESDLIAELERLGGVRIDGAPLPPPPDYIERRRPVDLSEAPRTTVVRFAEPPRIDRASAHAVTESGDATIFSSSMGAQVAGLAAALRMEGHRIGLNLVGQPFGMPLANPVEGPGLAYGTDPTLWQAFSGRSRVADAWQLVESARQIRSGSPTSRSSSDARNSRIPRSRSLPRMGASRRRACSSTCLTGQEFTSGVGRSAATRRSST